MSAMEFREPNEVLWRGVRPGHKGTQILVSKSKDNGTETLYEVSAGKTLFLCSLFCSPWADITGNWNLVSDDGIGGGVIFYAVGRSVAATSKVSWSHCFNPPLELPAGYRVRFFSGAAGLIVYTALHGWEE